MNIIWITIFAVWRGREYFPPCYTGYNFNLHKWLESELQRQFEGCEPIYEEIWISLTHFGKNRRDWHFEIDVGTDDLAFHADMQFYNNAFYTVCKIPEQHVITQICSTYDRGLLSTGERNGKCIHTRSAFVDGLCHTHMYARGLTTNYIMS